MGKPNFSDLFKRIVLKQFQESRVYFRHYAADGKPSFNTIMVEGYAALFSCTAVVQVSDSMTASM